MDKHIELDYVISQHSKHLDFDNDFAGNEQVLSSIRIPNLNPNIFKSNSSRMYQVLPVNGRQSNILKSGQYCSALFVDVHVRSSKTNKMISFVNNNYHHHSPQVLMFIKQDFEFVSKPE